MSAARWCAADASSCFDDDCPKHHHVHEWEDAPDDETGWYCPGCGYTEYPGMVDEITPHPFKGPSGAAPVEPEPPR